MSKSIELADSCLYCSSIGWGDGKLIVAPLNSRDVCYHKWFVFFATRSPLCENVLVEVYVVPSAVAIVHDVRSILVLSVTSSTLFEMFYS